MSILELEHENRHLKEIIKDLRQKLTDRNIAHHNQEQMLLNDKNKEILNLQNTIIDIRKKTQLLTIEYEQKIQSTISDFQLEKLQLIETIRLLRMQLEQANASKA